MLKAPLPNSPLLSDILHRNNNNFDVLRLIAAAAVIIGHAYPIAPQPPLQDFVLSILHFEYSGSLAVKFFFFLTGLLVSDSLIRKPEPLQFLIRRAFRIFPGFFLCLLVAIFIVGPIFTKLSIGDYFTQKETWTYFTKNISLIDLQWRLPGVFNDSQWGLNGSLWTLPYETMCYLFIAIFCGLGFFSVRLLANILSITIIMVAFLAPQFLPRFAQNPDSFMLAACFSLGIFFAINKHIIRINFQSVILLWIFVLLVNIPNARHFLFYLAFFYTAIFVASLKFIINKFKLPFDASYGIYIYGFMIQQCVHATYPTMGVHGNQFISFILSFILGITSWFLIEKNSIAFGNKLTSPDWIKNKRFNIPQILPITPGGESLQKTILTSSFIILELSVLFIIAFIIHALVLSFIFPAYYHPLTPQHSDYYIPAELANSSAGFFSYMSWARPVGMMFFYTIGHFGIYGSTALIVGITILNCALSAALLRRILKIDFKWPLLAVFSIYSYLVFSEAHFYSFYSQDAFAHLSYFFLMLGVGCFYMLYKKSILVANMALFFFTLLAFLSKETYGLSALVVTCAWFLYSYRQSILRAIMPTLMVTGALTLSLCYNAYVHSPYLSSPAYKVNFSLRSIFTEWSQYAHEGLNVAHIGLFVLIALACYCYFKQVDRKRFFYIFLGCIIAAFFAWLPNSFIPSHHFSGYSWSGASILFLPVLLIPMLWKNEVWSKVVVVTLLGICIINPIFNKKEYTKNDWVLYQENTQHNLLKALSSLIGDIKPTSSLEKILITGLTFPFSPFDHPGSLQTFPNAYSADFDVVRYTSIAHGERIDHVRNIVPSEINLEEYSQIWVFNNDGSLLRVAHKNEPISVPLLRISV